MKKSNKNEVEVSPQYSFENLQNLNIFELRPKEVDGILANLGLNVLGKIGEKLKRVCYAQILKEKSITFDLDWITKTLEFIEQAEINDARIIFETDGDIDEIGLNLDNDEAVRNFQELFQILFKADVVEYTPNSTRDELKKTLIEVLEILRDLRPLSKRKGKKQLNSEEEASKILGYTREDLYGKITAESLIAKIQRKNLPIDCNDPFYLQYMMEQLLDRVIRKIERKKDFDNKPFPQFKLDDIENFSLNKVYKEAIDLGIVSHTLSPIEKINQLDEVIFKLKNWILKRKEEEETLKIDIEKICQTLPPPSGIQKKTETSVCSVIVNSSTNSIITHILRNDNIEIREIGLRCDKKYFWKREIDDSKNILNVSFSLQVTDQQMEENHSKSLNEILRNLPNNKIIEFLFLDLEKSDDGPSIFQLKSDDLMNNNWRLFDDHQFKSFKFISLPCYPLILTDQKGIPFQRLVLQVRILKETKSGEILPKISENFSSVLESGQVLLKLFEAYEKLNNTNSFKEKEETIKNFPLLLYHLSPKMIELFPGLLNLVKRHWESVLEFSNRYDTPFLKEAKECLLHLLIPTKNQTFQIAVLTSDHLHYIKMLTKEYTKHLYFSFSIERSNFQAIVRILSQMNLQSETIIISLRVTGRLSPLDLSHLLERFSSGSIRIIFCFFPQLIQSLQLIGKKASVFFPQSLDHFHQIIEVKYEKGTLLGDILHSSQIYYNTNPQKLIELSELEKIKRSNESEIDWMNEEEKWRKEKRKIYQATESEKSDFLLLICPDSTLLDYYYNIKRKKGEPIHFIDSRSLFDVNNIFTQKEQDPHENEFCLVLKNSHLLSPSHWRVIIMKAQTLGYQVIFILPYYHPEYLKIEISEQTTHTKKVVEAKVLFPLLNLDLFQEVQMIKHKIAQFRVLRLIFGSIMKFEFIFSMEKLESLLFSECQLLDLQVEANSLQKTINTLINLVNFYSSNQNKVVEELEEIICELCFKFIEKNEMKNDIPFERFVQQYQLCQWLPQFLRIEAWIRTVLLSPKDVLNSSKELLVKKFLDGKKGTSCHSNNLLIFLSEGNERASLEDESPSYLHQDLDYSLNYRDLVLQQCVQGRELNWGDLSQRWKNFPFSLDFLMNLIRVYPQPLKILTLISTTNLFRILENTKKERFEIQIKILKESLTTEVIKLLEQFSPAFLSVIKWALLSNGNVSPQDLVIEDRDIQNLIDLFISIKINENLSDIVLPLLLKLEGPKDVFYNQVGLREFFFHEEIQLEKKNLGTAILEFALHESIREKAKESPSKLLSHPFFRDLIKWYELNQMEQARNFKFLELSIVPSFSQEAIGYLISQSRSIYHTQSLICIIKEYLKIKNTDFFLILKLAISRNQATEVSFLIEQLEEFWLIDDWQQNFSQYFDSSLTEGSLDTNYLLALLESYSKKNLSELIKFFLTYKKNDQLKLSLEEFNPKLRALFLNYFSDKEIHERTSNIKDSDVIDIALNVKPSSQWDILAQISTSKELQDSHVILGTVFWILNPRFDYPIGNIDFQILQDLITSDKLNFGSLMAIFKHTASPLALYLACPYLLDINILDFYSKKCRKPKIKSHHKSLPFGLKEILFIPERPFPQDLLNYFSSIIQKHNFEKISQQDYYSVVSKFYELFDVTSGVNESTILKNIQLLKVVIDDLEDHTLENPDLIKPHEYQIIRNIEYLIGSIVVAWFWSFGLNVDKLKEHFSFSNLEQIFEDFEKETDLNNELIIDFYIPTFLNTKFQQISTKDLALFGKDLDEKIYTLSTIIRVSTSLSFQFPLPLPPRITETEYKELPQKFSKAVALNIAEKIGNNLGKVETFFDLTSQFLPFVQMLIEIANDPEFRDTLLTSFFSEFKNRITKNPKESSSFLSRMFLISIPLKQKNKSLVEEILKQFLESGLSIDKDTYELVDGYFTYIKGHLNALIYMKIQEKKPLFEMPLQKPNFPRLSIQHLKEDYLDPLNSFVNIPMLEGSEKVNSEKIDHNDDENIYQGSFSLLGEHSFFHSSQMSPQTTQDHQLHESEKPIAFENSWILHCNSLIQFESTDASYGYFKIKSGKECFLEIQNEEYFFKSENAKENSSISNRIGIYPSYAEAWKYINERAPPLSLIILDGMLLKKSRTGTGWHPVISSLNGVEEVYFFHLLMNFQLLNINLPHPVKQFLLFLCSWLFKLVNTNQQFSKEEVWKWVLKLNSKNLPNNEYQNIIQQSQKISEVICEVIDQSSNIRVDSIRASNLIQNVIKEKKWIELLNCWINVDLRLEPFLLKTVGWQNLMKQILQREVPVIKNKLNSSQLISMRNMIEKIKPIIEWEEEFDSSEERTEDNPFGGRIFDGFGAEKIIPNTFFSIGSSQPDLYIYFPFSDKSLSLESDDIICYIIHKNVFRVCFNELPSTPRTNFSLWVLRVLNSPLGKEDKEWFMLRAQKDLMREFPFINDEKIMYRIIAFTLASNCPDQRLRSYFVGSINLPEDLKKFCSRKDEKYGVYICGSETLKQMRKHKIQVETIDLTVLASEGTVMLEDLYLRIISNFTENSCFVYVHGLPIIKDQLLKWCCEYTAKYPWRFIYFENTDISFNFSENRDRCDFTFYQQLNETNSENTEVNYRQVKSFEDVLKDPIENIKPRAHHKWEKKLEENLKEAENCGGCVILLISPPGAGKTWRLEKEIEKKQKEGYYCPDKPIDCSNDEFVKRSLYSILNEMFPEQGKKSFVCFDEYHMLSREHKEELLTWVTSRLNWLQVVLIGNRENAYDQKLLDRVKKEVGNSVIIKKILGRLRIKKILTDIPSIQEEIKKTQSSGNIKLFLEMWLTASRALFSDESLSLRIIEGKDQLIEQFKTQEVENLQNFLQKKMPTLGKPCCELFCQDIFKLWKEIDKSTKDFRKYCAEIRSFESPIRLLVSTALLSNDEICSYEDFMRQMKNSHHLHPLLRIAIWVKMVREKSTLPTDLDSLSTLKKLKVIDQPIFPRIEYSASDSPLDKCSALTRKGNYMDLEWLMETLEHGYNLDWTLAKEQWSNQYLTNALDLAHLLSVTSDPGSCLDAVDPRNISSLIESQREMSLAEQCIEHSKEYQMIDDPQKILNLIEKSGFSDSVFFSASWFVFKNQNISRVKENKKIMNSLPLIFLWASEFASDKLEVLSGASERTKELRTQLFKISSDLVEKRNNTKGKERLDWEKIIIKLWSFIFRPLLDFSEEMNNGVPFEIAFILAFNQTNIREEWPEIISVINKIYWKTDLQQSQSRLTQICKILRHSSGEDGFCDHKFIEGILSIPDLDISVQRALLESQYLKFTKDIPEQLLRKNLLPYIYSLKESRNLKQIKANYSENEYLKRIIEEQKNQKQEKEEFSEEEFNLDFGFDQEEF